MPQSPEPAPSWQLAIPVLFPASRPSPRAQPGASSAPGKSRGHSDPGQGHASLPLGGVLPPWCGHGFHGGAKSQSDGRAAADPSALVLPLPPGRQRPCSRRHSPSPPLAPLGLGPPRTGSSLSSHPLPAASSFKSGLSVARSGDDRTPCGPPRRSRRAGCGRPGAGGHWDHIRALGHHQPGPRTPSPTALSHGTVPAACPAAAT